MFSDTDPLEEEFGVRCEDMSPDQLVSYIQAYHSAFGINVCIEGIRERSVFKAMQRTYGKRDSGLIVKWVFYKHKGHWDGEPVLPFSFMKGRKWWVDKMHMEMQQAMKTDKGRVGNGAERYVGTTLGGRGLADI